ncbi:MAG: hypothetical protein KDD33_09050 [Bdellovibrionales bacterium]|nr:hypothetical protein [Bdellovibrionales bacterium]
MGRILIACMVFIFSLPSMAGRRAKYFAVYSQYTSFSDLLTDSSNNRKYLSAENSLNFDIRLMRIFVLNLHGGQAVDNQRRFSGAGIKVDLPGFFMLGGSINDLIHRRKRKPINTSFGYKSFIVQQQGQGDRYASGRFILATDIMLGSFFINLELGLYNQRGDQYLSTAAGLGVEF